jgi:hypothetical protein
MARTVSRGPGAAAALLLAVAGLFAGCGSGGSGPIDAPDAIDAPSDVPGGDTAPGDPGPSFTHDILIRSLPDGATDIATGDFRTLSVEYPPFPVDPRYTRVLNWKMAAFMPPYLKPMKTFGPLVLYDDDLDVLVFGALDHPFETLMWLEDGQIRHGVPGEVESLPAGWTHRFLLVEGRGINATLERFGDLVLEDRGRARVDRYADTGLSYLGYWTDNGAYYYYAKEPGLNEEQTLLAVKKEADDLHVPYGYFQIDSWWYRKAPGESVGTTGGCIAWEPLPDVFPDGVAAFRARLGLPLIAHNKWFAKDTEYLAKYDFVEGDGMVFPTGRGVFDELLASCVAWGIETYEQDWFSRQWWSVPWLRQAAGRGEAYVGDIAQAAADAGRTVQLCMAEPSHLAAATRHPSVTTFRTSNDYHQGVSKESWWPQFHAAAMLSWSLGVWPFKDVFQSAERAGAQEALISVLSGGMVGVGDGLGKVRTEFVLPTCRSDGLLLKPDRPATPVDTMFLPHRRPYVTATRSDRPGLGRWHYVAAYHLASAHPDRTAEDLLWAAFATDPEDPVEQTFVFPEAVDDWHLDPAADLHATGRLVAYDWRAGTARVVEGRFDLEPFPALYDWAYLVLAPVFDNGLALVGETGKYVTVADRRFTAIEPRPDGIRVVLAGAPGEKVTVRAFDADAGAMLAPFEATIGAGGAAELVLSR